ncbi:hypothetical protein SNE40_019726 [Patella caerulea]|uniref:Uncharacterized protein n=1 Tax=Patella caerulea TaxID=87958 RepID=A0AAN8PA52_PATCE
MMKLVLVALCVVVVAAYAVEVDMDFLESALAFKEQAMRRDAEENTVKRAMIDLNGQCSELNGKCHMFRPCCNNENVRCTNFLGGACVPRI